MVPESGSRVSGLPFTTIRIAVETQHSESDSSLPPTHIPLPRFHSPNFAAPAHGSRTTTGSPAPLAHGIPCTVGRHTIDVSSTQGKHSDASQVLKLANKPVNDARPQSTPLPCLAHRRTASRSLKAPRALPTHAQPSGECQQPAPRLQASQHPPARHPLPIVPRKLEVRLPVSLAVSRRAGCGVRLQFVKHPSRIPWPTSERRAPCSSGVRRRLQLGASLPPQEPVPGTYAALRSSDSGVCDGISRLNAGTPGRPGTCGTYSTWYTVVSHLQLVCSCNLRTRTRSQAVVQTLDADV